MSKNKKESKKESKGSGGGYLIDSKIFSNAITKCMGIISLGEKADGNVLTLDFTKKGLAIEAKNSVASFRSDLPVEVLGSAPQRVSVIPEALLAYAKSYKELLLTPSGGSLDVSYGKSFSAKVFYVGNPEDMDIRKDGKGEDISNISTVASSILNLVSGIRNRTDTQPLGVIFGWGNKTLELTVGDTHHAIVVDAKIKSKSENSITTTLPNLQKIMSIGNNFNATDDMFYAWSETEYLSIANRTDNMFLADVARAAIENGKKTTKVKVQTAKLRELVDTLTAAVEETAIFTFKLTDGKIMGSISTSSGSARAVIKTDEFSGKEITTSVAVHHLRDCLSAMKEKITTVAVLGNMVTFEGSSDGLKVVAAMTAVGTK